MLRVLANDHYAAMSFDDLAFLADLLYGWLYFHLFYHTFPNYENVSPVYFVLQVMRPLVRS